MSDTSRVLVKIAAAMAVLALSVVLLAGAVVYETGGWVVVKVQEKGSDAPYIPTIVVPVGLLRAAFAFVPDHDLCEAGRQAARWQPLIEAAAEGLAACEDGALVQVDSGRERVRIHKSGSSLVV